MADYLVFDIETTYGKTNGRVGNRWDHQFGLCSAGWLRGSGEYTADYTVKNMSGIYRGLNPMRDELPMPCLDGVTLLVGQNLKFDLIWYWDHPELIKFLARGGKIWDTMYAEYLLSGQLYNQNAPHEEYRINLKQCGIRRGLTYAKQDVVKALWDSGIRTEDIKEAVLMEYMEYDIRTTDELFKAQVKQAREQNQVRMIMNAMDGLLASTEMEFNGMKIDKELALKQAAELEQSLEDLRLKLDTYVPELPIGCTFSWGSWRNLSALLFGGEIPYVGREYVLDEDGNKTYYQKQVVQTILDEEGNEVRYKQGKRAGEVKTKLVKVKDIERGPKERNCIKTVVLPQMVKPSSRWAASESYPDGTPKYYSVSKTVIDSLKSKKVALVDDLLEFRKIDKDLGTYYIRTKIVKGNEVHTGMLTNIQPTDGCVHGTLNHCITVTRRLSGSEPNLQNISAKGNIKSTFVSRFDGGVVAEIDYSQLEVVTQGVNSMDANLLKALADGVCFHCEWASFVTGESYENVFQWAKIDEDPVWVKHRQDAKPLGFGENYGAGIPTLAENSGVDPDLIEKAIAARKKKYNKLYEFHENVQKEVESTRTLTKMRTEGGYQRCVGYYRSVTGTIYHFLENEAPKFKQDQGIHTAFSPTTIKNYPSQGLGGEIMQTMSGLVLRMLIRFALRDDVKMILTVHDSVYFDFRTPELAKEYLPKIAAVLEMVVWYFRKCFKGCEWSYDTPFFVSAEYGQNTKAVGHKDGVPDTIRGTVKERDYEWVDIIKREFK